MAKSLCKYRRVEITAQFSTISRMVSTANYMCSSCARVASEKGYLCKPSALKRPTDMAHVIKPSLAAVEAVAVDTAAVSEVTNVSSLARASAPAPVLATKLDTPVPVIASHPAVVACRKVARKKAKQLKKLKKLAKKQNKQLKKAIKATRRYHKAIEKAQASV
ncbi:hypothetical protein ACQKPX_20500 [Photobacterium sp. DNB23_23_1]|uniref:Uncharacterized protein n=1 Tax=Photobacterium pectinilyticum TaxID=2906793 RepID=A0ABT1N294_9GAMM|nr:hypothetical protein [Photobacterium sp. ZSDE20]MCQ1057881.1 hypothetical protein [Photobacterium sp. ZSDE20]MDD1822413.1 hypothetical protein [Photobacterium sp. ZSDE20]